ncbi:helix-turn-helix transcriptional regulator [Mycolicibacterium austroafricanum]|uniref:helix-turn-helix transcriptional regulator n=1 Tax=Mycolicibacterium austroafricanum TaxID=39687 RepID=UPI001CA32E28|nr:LuxR family transcriptional regulator [Mycolicibacterium austroafricanum]QZT58665.1 LuxR C-terminal-related transcriptional regulator [Mycolicibacterium austroafricanum]
MRSALPAGMMSPVSGASERSIDDPHVAGFLATARSQPAGLVIEGEAGIGKTTLWLTVRQRAGDLGFRVLTARAGQAESVMAFAALADLLDDVGDEVFAALPGLQRLALDRVLLRAGGDGPPTDQRVVAAAFVSVLQALAGESPVLIAIDDAQWLDSSSRAAIEFAVRRLRGPFGVLVTERCAPGEGATAGWLKLDRPDALERVYVRPMTTGQLHSLISERLGRTLARPSILRIAEISGGNPFFALELALALSDGQGSGEPPLPATLADVVRHRIGRLDEQTRSVLLSIACVADATVELLARAHDVTAEEVTERLERVESTGIITVEGNRVRFTHPLLASGVYTDAGPTARRAMHRTMGALESQPELKARHLALASASGDDEIFTALDQAADSARARGAPAAAAELMDLAIGLGADDPLRRMKSAENHFLAGDTAKAAAALGRIDTIEPPVLRALAASLLATVRMYENEHTEAVELLRGALDDGAGNVPILVQVLLRLSFALNSIGDLDDAARYVRDAVKLAEELGVPGIISAALAWSVHVNIQCGRGLDEESLRRAMELYDSTLDVPIIFRAPFVHALVMSWTGRLEQAHRELTAMRAVCVERGAESDMMAIAGFLAINHLWRGQIAEAEAEASEAVERAEQLGGDDVLIIPMTVRGTLAAYAGRVEDARADARWVLDAVKNRQTSHIADWPGMTLCFLEESLRNHREALQALDAKFLDPKQMRSTELMYAWHLPDVIEAMVGVGRLDEAESLTGALEQNGIEHDRHWMKAVGMRCRAMLLAARGDVIAAEQTAHRAMAEHDRLPMPFERARTQLLLGQLQRRLRQKNTAATNLNEALRTFEEMGAPLWVRRARAELARAVVAPAEGLSQLTPSEQRVAEMAASGATNKDIAAAMFISAKTVEHNLTKIYRKLGISSRAELGRRMDRAGEP